MYVPKHFKEEDPAAVAAFLAEYPFGVLMSSVDDAMKGTHLPFMFDLTSEGFHLFTHLAAANDQLEHLRQKKDCLTIFQGPDSYISPSLYAEKQNVPTWNFIAVHLYGSHQLIEDYDGKKKLLERSIQTFDVDYWPQWLELKTGYKDRMIRGMCGISIDVTRFEAKYKLSQNRSKASRAKVAEHMAATHHPLSKFMNS